MITMRLLKLNDDFFFLNSHSAPIVLVGNKTDLHQERAVSADAGKRLAESWKASFLETSAKQNEVTRALLTIRGIVSEFVLIRYFSQSVADIFHSLLLQIEKENGNATEKSNCCIS